MTTPLLSISGLSKHYGGPTGRRVLKDLALELAPAEYAAVMGESGFDNRRC